MVPSLRMLQVPDMSMPAHVLLVQVVVRGVIPTIVVLSLLPPPSPQRYMAHAKVYVHLMHTHCNMYTRTQVEVWGRSPGMEERGMEMCGMEVERLIH